MCDVEVNLFLEQDQKLKKALLIFECSWHIIFLIFIKISVISIIFCVEYRMNALLRIHVARSSP